MSESLNIPKVCEECQKQKIYGVFYCKFCRNNVLNGYYDENSEAGDE